VEHGKASSQDTFTLVRNDDGVVALHPSSSLKASKNIRLDHMLEWEEMMMAKNMMLHYISTSKVWPQEHVMLLAAFFVRLETHTVRQKPHRNQVILLY